MAYIHVGLGVWHKDLLQEVDRIAGGLGDARQPGFSYPSGFSAIELQLGSPTNLSKHIGKTYDPWSFHAPRRDERLSRFHAEYSNGRNPDRSRSLENAVDQLLNHLRYRPFMGFHSSDGVYDPRLKNVIACDLSEPDEGRRQLTLTKYKNMMELAAALDADAFVLHPSAFHQWIDDMGSRKGRMGVFYNSFRELMSFYKQRGFGFTMSVENLEFSKFPATHDELIDLWHNCGNIAEQEGIHRGRVTICLDLQHLRHSLKIINEPGNYSRFSHTPGIDGLILGFPNIHRKFAGTSYNWCWKGLAYDPYDILHDLAGRAGQNLQVIHTAGNDENISSTHNAIHYRRWDEKIPYFALNNRLAVNMLMDHGFSGAIIVEDHSGTLAKHIHSGDAIAAYIKERVQR